VSEQTIVLKFGGSVLQSRDDLSRVAREIERFCETGHRVVAVVSAFQGATDALAEEAKAVQEEPEALALAYLLATGEFVSASLLSLTLSAHGTPAPVLGPSAIGLRTSGNGADTNPTSVNVSALVQALETTGVVVVPGFVGIGPGGELALLGRGGSDLSALFIASQLGARCRLVKDVAGMYESDPAGPGPTPRRYQTLGWAKALELDEAIVQHKAVRYAQRERLPFEVGAIARDDVTTVGEHAKEYYRNDREVACA